MENIGNLWENYRKTGKVLKEQYGKIWETYGKQWKTYGKHVEKYAKKPGKIFEHMALVTH